MKMQLPNNLDQFILEALEYLDSNDFPENYTHELEVKEIEHESYDGFIPFTDGGYHLTLFSGMGYCIGSGSYPEKLRPEVERLEIMVSKESLENLIDDHRHLLLSYFDSNAVETIDTDVIHYHSLCEKGLAELAESLREAEHSWHGEGSTFAYQCKVMYYSSDNHRNKSGEDEVLFISGVNTDYEYIRDSGLNVYFEKNIKVSDLTEELIKDTIIDMVNAVK